MLQCVMMLLCYEDGKSVVSVHVQRCNYEYAQAVCSCNYLVPPNVDLGVLQYSNSFPFARSTALLLLKPPLLHTYFFIAHVANLNVLVGIQLAHVNLV